MSQYNKGRKKKEEPNEDWLTTYADSITLLLCFFVILLSVSEPKMDRFEAMTEGLASGFVKDMIELPFKNVNEDFQLIIEDNAVELEIATEFTERGVQLDINSGALFNPGSADLKEESKKILEEMALSILDMELEEFRIEVEGHTDDTSVGKTSIYPSNWELSAARAAAIVRFLIDQNLPADFLKASGFADTRPKVPNFDVEGNPIPENRNQNRRVMLHVMRVQR